jgi:hypothetical protein
MGEMTTVSQRVKAAWIEKLRREILECSADSHVGKRVINYLQAVDIVLAMTDETWEHEEIEHAAVNQCNVWYFG